MNFVKSIACVSLLMSGMCFSGICNAASALSNDPVLLESASYVVNTSLNKSTIVIDFQICNDGICALSTYTLLPSETHTFMLPFNSTLTVSSATDSNGNKADYSNQFCKVLAPTQHNAGSANTLLFQSIGGNDGQGKITCTPHSNP